MVLLLPLSKRSLLLIAVTKAPIIGLNAIVIIRLSIHKILYSKERAAFSNLCVFITVLEKLRFHSGVM